MKTLIALLFSISTVSALAQSLNPQTNIYTTTMTGHAKLDNTCAGGHYWYVGNGNYIPVAMQVSNKWYYTTTNWHVISFTNNDAVIAYADSLGGAACAHGSLFFTNNNPAVKYRFGIYWSNNVVPVPTNGEFLPLTTFGFRTNAP